MSAAEEKELTTFYQVVEQELTSLVNKNREEMNRTRIPRLSGSALAQMYKFSHNPQILEMLADYAQALATKRGSSIVISEDVRRVRGLIDQQIKPVYVTDLELEMIDFIGANPGIDRWKIVRKFRNAQLTNDLLNKLQQNGQIEATPVVQEGKGRPGLRYSIPEFVERKVAK